MSCFSLSNSEVDVEKAYKKLYIEHNMPKVNPWMTHYKEKVALALASGFVCKKC